MVSLVALMVNHMKGIGDVSDVVRRGNVVGRGDDDCSPKIARDKIHAADTFTFRTLL